MRPESQFGTSPGAFVRARRVAWAAQVLAREPARALSEVAVAAGFYDQSHFARVFKAATGFAPDAWRCAHAPAPRA